MSALTAGLCLLPVGVLVEHGVWWLMLALGLGIATLGLLSTGRWARATAARAADLFEEMDNGAPAPRRDRVRGAGVG